MSRPPPRQPQPPPFGSGRARTVTPDRTVTARRSSTALSSASSTSSTATITPNNVNPAPKGPNMTLEHAKRELLERKLIANASAFTFNNLVDILLAFTGKEEHLDALGEPWEIVVAVGVLIKENMVCFMAEATADATATRMQSMLAAAEEEAKKSHEEKTKMLETKEKVADRELRVRKAEVS
ncbi:hypothetical protein FRC08_001088 [Ceratobasidium sp. 394]|nr:hypothetical protein FRC08_001088 [Ceratobasidium sp. 394]KAG9077022.1 hypothetical protein FS749_011136 [Ceratobasidium sp. UAMH 11750]